MRILRGYCSDDRPKNVYWVVDPVRGQVNVSKEVQISE